MLLQWYTTYKNRVFEDFNAYAFILDISSLTPGPYHIGFVYDCENNVCSWRGLHDPDEHKWSGWVESKDDGWEIVDARIVLVSLFHQGVE